MLEGPENGHETLNFQVYEDRFIQAMESDLNTPQALAALFELVREINRTRESGGSVGQAQSTLRKLGGVLGFNFHEPPRGLVSESKAFIDLLTDIRSELRSTRQYALADQIRKRLGELGVVLEDTSRGTRWKSQ